MRSIIASLILLAITNIAHRASAAPPARPAPPAIAPATSPALALIDAWRAAEEKRNRFTLDYTNVISADGLYDNPDYARLSGKATRTAHGEVRFDRGRIFFSNSESVASTNKHLATANNRPRVRTWIWDGRVHYFHTPGTSLVITTGRGSLGVDRMDPTGIPRGYLCNMSDPIDVVLRGAKTVRLRPAPEMIDGSPCQVVEATGKEGRQTLWIDTARGHCLVKAQVHLAEGDLHLGGKPLQKGYRLNVTLSNVKLQQIDGTWFTTAFTYDDDRIFPTGFAKSRAECTFTNIKLNPDFDAMRAFVPAVDEGTLVRLTGDNSDRKYTWHAGEIRDEHGRKVKATSD